jgi:alkanesulfonate monooxygenase SsuD/methylene tetrahydromethanopterin reductase-like flavin-dependent oxidoreductase (luciferase family)
MGLVRVVASRASSRVLDHFGDTTPVFRCSDADTAIVLGSWSDALTSEVGVWLRVSDGYSAQIVARDVRTLSVLTNLRHVVIESADRARENADIVRALLSGEEVNMSNSVATLRHAYSRPAPPRPLTVWSYANSELTSPEGILREVPVEGRSDAALTYFDS